MRAALAPLLLVFLAACARGARPAGWPKASDVLLTSRAPHYTPAGAPPQGVGAGVGLYDTNSAIEAFDATRLDWVYTLNGSFVEELRLRHNITDISLAMNPQVADADGRGYGTGRVLNAWGQPLVAPWMRTWAPPHRYYGCVNNPAYKQLAIARARRLVALGATAGAPCSTLRYARRLGSTLTRVFINVDQFHRRRCGNASTSTIAHNNGATATASSATACASGALRAEVYAFAGCCCRTLGAGALRHIVMPALPRTPCSGATAREAVARRATAASANHAREEALEERAREGCGTPRRARTQLLGRHHCIARARCRCSNVRSARTYWTLRSTDVDDLQFHLRVSSRPASPMRLRREGS